MGNLIFRINFFIYCIFYVQTFFLLVQSDINSSNTYVFISKLDKNFILKYCFANTYCSYRDIIFLL